MPKAVQRKAAKRGGKPSRRVARNGVKSADFCAAARDALKRGEPDAISDKTLQQVLTAAVKVYAAKVERRGHDVVPFPQHAVTATETVVDGLRHDPRRRSQHVRRGDLVSSPAGD